MAEDGKSLRIKVGIAVDASAASVMAPIEKAAKRARKTVEQEMAAAGKAIEKEIAKGAREAGKAETKLDKELEREANKILKVEQNAQKARVREVTAAARERIRVERQAQREVEQLMAKAAREAKKAADAEAKLRATPFYNRSLGGGGAIGIGRRAGIRVSRPFAAAYGYGGAALSGMMGIAREAGYETDFGEYARRSISDAALATKISNSGYIPGQTSLVAPGKVLETATNVSIATGTERGEALGALEAFVSKTGDLQTGLQSLQQMAMLSRATGSNLEDMANAAAEVTNNLGNVPDKARVTQKIMQMIAGQGKLGAVEIRDLAAQMAKLASASGAFKGGAMANLGILGVMAQESKLRGGSASATQAATSVLRFASDLTKPTTLKNWQKMGISPFADKTGTILTDPKSIIEAALKAADRNGHGANLQTLGKLFPNAMSFRAVRGFASIYNEAGGGQGGMRAVEEEFRRLSAAQMDETEVMRAFSASMSTSEAKSKVFNAEMQQVADHLEGDLVPALEAAAPAIVALAQAASGAIDAILNPGANKTQKPALAAQNEALNFIGKLHGFEETNVTAPSPLQKKLMAGSEMWKDTFVRGSMAAVAPILDEEKQREAALGQSITATKADMGDFEAFRANHAGLTDKDIKTIAAGGKVNYGGVMLGGAGNLQVQANRYLQDKDQLDRLNDTLSSMRGERDKLIDALLSGQVVVTVKDSSGAKAGNGQHPMAADVQQDGR